MGAVLAGVFGVLVLGAVGLSGWRLLQAQELARASEPWQQAPPEPVLRLLVIGDSTAVGTGASDAAHSLIGLIGRAHPRLAIDNRARDGATLADLPAQLAGAPGRADIVLVMAGGNDVIRLRDMDRVRADLDHVLRAARERADQVLLMPAGNVGNAPFFLPPLSWWMTARARTLHAQVREAAAAHRAVVVNLFHPAAEDPFVQQPGLHAADGLHPSDAGYAAWWRTLDAQAGLSQRLAAAR